MDQKEIEEAALEQGWSIGRTKKGHLRFVPADKSMPIVIGAGTPSDHRSLKNFLAQCRRSGLVWPPPGKKKSR